jgi:hypothetical protein
VQINYPRKYRQYWGDIRESVQIGRCMQKISFGQARRVEILAVKKKQLLYYS